jgi:hypothetical protein
MCQILHEDALLHMLALLDLLMRQAASPHDLYIRKYRLGAALHGMAGSSSLLILSTASAN